MSYTRLGSNSANSASIALEQVSQRSSPAPTSLVVRSSDVGVSELTARLLT